MIRKEKNPNGNSILKYADHEFSQVYGQTKEAIKSLIKDDILQIYMSDHDLGYSNEGEKVGDYLNGVDIRCQEDFMGIELIKKEFKRSAEVPASVDN